MDMTEFLRKLRIAARECGYHFELQPRQGLVPRDNPSRFEWMPRYELVHQADGYQLLPVQVVWHCFFRKDGEEDQPTLQQERQLRLSLNDLRLLFFAVSDSLMVGADQTEVAQVLRLREQLLRACDLDEIPAAHRNTRSTEARLKVIASSPYAPVEGIGSRWT